MADSWAIMRTCNEFGFRTESTSPLTESLGEIEACVVVAASVHGRTAMPSIGMRRTTRMFTQWRCMTTNFDKDSIREIIREQRWDDFRIVSFFFF